MGFSKEFSRVNLLIKAVLSVMHKDPSTLRYARSHKITARNLEDAAGNHLFDDHPELFGLIDIGGHRIREYFQTAAQNGYQHIIDLHQNFPDIMEGEDEDYMEIANEEREKHGLEPIVL